MLERRVRFLELQYGADVDTVELFAAIRVLAVHQG